jgi:hypothetical protein
MLKEIGFGAAGEWDDAVEACAQADFYHLYGFHAVARGRGEGEPVLLAWDDGQVRLVLPLLLRPIRGVPGLEETAGEAQDATSVYGYAGPLSSARELPENSLKAWRVAMSDWAKHHCIVSVFSRLHPLWDGGALLAGLGEVVEHGTTVSLDLTLPLAAQCAKYRSTLRYDVRKLRRLGYTVLRDGPFAHVGEFAQIYLETMRRVGSSSYYLFDRGYFEELLRQVSGVFQLFVVLHEGAIVSAGLFSLYRGIVQFHLSGTRGAYLRASPAKLLLDEVRLWAAAAGARVFHLGGGLGGQADSLFDFKAGFSDRRHGFSLWKWMVDQGKADALTTARLHWLAKQGRTPAAGAFFPAYRA